MLTRRIRSKDITRTVAKLCIRACTELEARVSDALATAELNALAAAESDNRGVIAALIENAEIARRERIPMCQDTGLVTVYAEVGQGVRVIGGGLTDAINEGVRQGYRKGYLRKSVVGCPLRRENTQDNTPAVIYYDIVEGRGLTLTVMPKGFGSENMGGISMLTPSQGWEGARDFIVDTVRRAGANPCPPIFVGVGLGGTLDKAAAMAKHALLRGGSHPDAFIAEKEQEVLGLINALNIGPAGFGGTPTALGVYIETFPTHIAGLPVAVNISCHALRYKTAVIKRVLL